MLTRWQEELLLKEQSQVTLFSNPFLSSKILQFPSPLHGSLLKSQSFFPSFFPISLNTLTAMQNTYPLICTWAFFFHIQGKSRYIEEWDAVFLGDPVREWRYCCCIDYRTLPSWEWSLAEAEAEAASPKETRVMEQMMDSCRSSCGLLAKLQAPPIFFFFFFSRGLLRALLAWTGTSSVWKERVGEIKKAFIIV